MPDDSLTSIGERRSVGWPLLLLDYTKSREVFINPSYYAKDRIFKGPAMAQDEEGYNSSWNTYRNQSLYPGFGLNYQFISPIRARRPYPQALADAIPESRSLKSAEDPAATIFFAVSQRSPSAQTGFFAINAPGMWSHLSERSPYIALWLGSQCSGGWCRDTDQGTRKEERTRGFVTGMFNGGSSHAFVDGHVKYMKDFKAAAGTDFPGDWATVQRQYLRGDCVIIDKSKYLWNLNDEFIDEAIATEDN